MRREERETPADPEPEGEWREGKEAPEASGSRGCSPAPASSARPPAALSSADPRRRLRPGRAEPGSAAAVGFASSAALTTSRSSGGRLQTGLGGAARSPGGARGRVSAPGAPSLGRS